MVNLATSGTYRGIAYANDNADVALVSAHLKQQIRKLKSYE